MLKPTSNPAHTTFSRETHFSQALTAFQPCSDSLINDQYLKNIPSLIYEKGAHGVFRVDEQWTQSQMITSLQRLSWVCGHRLPFKLNWPTDGLEPLAERQSGWAGDLWSTHRPASEPHCLCLGRWCGVTGPPFQTAGHPYHQFEAPASSLEWEPACGVGGYKHSTPPRIAVHYSSGASNWPGSNRQI